MDNARQIRRPWRSWTVIALVLVGLALVQACGKSGSSTGPTSGSALQLKLRRAGGALLPAGCSGGNFKISAPGQPTITGALQGGQINVSLTVGVTYLIEVSGITCPGIPGQLSGSTTFTVPPGGGSSEIVINVSQVLGLSCSPSTVEPDEESTCTCDASSPGIPSITWTGSVNPKTGKSVGFKESTPGTYQVSCTINGIDTRSTAVTVEEPEAPPPPPPPPPATGSLNVTNTATGCCAIDGVTFSSPAIASISGLDVGQSVSRSNIPPGNYTATWCFGTTSSFTIQAGQTTQLNLNGNSCG